DADARESALLFVVNVVLAGEDRLVGHGAGHAELDRRRADEIPLPEADPEVEPEGGDGAGYQEVGVLAHDAVPAPDELGDQGVVEDLRHRFRGVERSPRNAEQAPPVADLVGLRPRVADVSHVDQQRAKRCQRTCGRSAASVRAGEALPAYVTVKVTGVRGGRSGGKRRKQPPSTGVKARTASGATRGWIPTLAPRRIFAADTRYLPR